MSKAVLISIRPEWCEKIVSGKKTIEVRKTRPKLQAPFKCYISETKTGFRSKSYENDILVAYEYAGKIIGEFVCDGIYAVVAHPDVFAGHPLFFDQAIKDACLSEDEVLKYSSGKDVFGWHISALKIYDTPKALSKFYRKCDEGCPSCDLWKSIRVNAEEYDMECSSGLYGHKPLTRPPQSWCYVEDIGGAE